jgi:hypothetical protein
VQQRSFFGGVDVRGALRTGQVGNGEVHRRRAIGVWRTLGDVEHAVLGHVDMKGVIAAVSLCAVVAALDGAAKSSVRVSECGLIGTQVIGDGDKLVGDRSDAAPVAGGNGVHAE